MCQVFRLAARCRGLFPEEAEIGTRRDGSDNDDADEQRRDDWHAAAFFRRPSNYRFGLDRFRLGALLGPGRGRWRWSWAGCLQLAGRDRFGRRRGGWRTGFVWHRFVPPGRLLGGFLFGGFLFPPR